MAMAINKTNVHDIKYKLTDGLQIFDPNVPQSNQSEPLLTIQSCIGAGTFGRVYAAKMHNYPDLVAVKLVDNNPNAHREISILQSLSHCNIVRMLKNLEFKQNSSNFLLIVMEYMPMSLLDYLSAMRNCPMDFFYVRLLSYQLFRALAFLENLNVCHRDVKPSNILFNPGNYNLKLADFGSAKWLKKDCINYTYICSRLYRAPELYYTNKYDTKMDVWSAGCVLGELIKGVPIFACDYRGTFQLLHIVQVIGTEGLKYAPKVHNICAHYKMKESIGVDRKELLGREVPSDLLDLFEMCLNYDPQRRISPLEACAHESYDELRHMNSLRIELPNKMKLPPLFDFSSAEINSHPELWIRLLPVYFPNLQENEDNATYNLIEQEPIPYELIEHEANI